MSEFRVTPQGNTAGTMYCLSMTSREQARAVPNLFFSGKTGPLKRYGIRPDQVGVNATVPVGERQKRLILEKLAAAHEHALKSHALGNFSDFYPAYSIQTQDGQWTTATLMETSREITMCAERAALISGLNRVLERTPLKRLQHPGGKEKVQRAMQVKLLIAASHLPPGEGKTGCPCADCSQWLASNTFVPSDALFAFMEKQPSGRLLLNIRTMKEMYPQKGRQKASFTSTPLNQLKPAQFSRKGRQVFNRLVREGLVNDSTPRQLLAVAKEAWEANQTTAPSGMQTGVALLLDNGKIVPGKRFDITKRWFFAADTLALATGIQSEAQKGKASPKVIGAAYFSTDPEVPSMESIGRLIQATWGIPDLLIITLEGDRPKGRTTGDYMTRPYISRLTSRIPAK